MHCKFPGQGKGTKPPQGESSRLVALSVKCERAVFVAFGQRSIEQGPGIFPDEAGSAIFSGGETGHYGPVRYVRFASAFAKSGFSFTEDLASATVKPPPPFHGSAALRRLDAKRVEWTGDLRVSLPGSEVALTGPRCKAELSRPADGEGASAGFRGPGRGRPGDGPIAQRARSVAEPRISIR